MPLPRFALPMLGALLAWLTLAGCGQQRMQCSANLACPENFVCVWDSDRGQGVCAHACGSCAVFEQCEECLASGTCPECTVCVAACWDT